MTNPVSLVWGKIAKYGRDLKNAPRDQYITRVAAESINPVLTTMPPPAYSPPEAGARPVSPTWSYDSVAEAKAQIAMVQQLEHGQQQREATAAGKKETKEKKKKKGGAFDFVVKAAGSRWTFAFTLCLLVVWAVIGAVYGATDTWQVIFQDTSSIQCYISATLLMRQQQNSTKSLLNTICGMLSRSQGNERMIRQLTPKQLAKLKRSQRMTRTDLPSALETKETVFDRVANAVSRFLGSLSALAIYWAGILVWVFWGIPLEWSDTWQLYVNTATALELTFTTMFLQNVRRQHEEYLDRCLRSIDIVDRDLEMELRRMTGDTRPNPVAESQPPQLTRIEKAIDFWAFIVGGSVGVVLSLAVAVAWGSVGDFMGFDDNWWLIIGTYTGLMGFVDGFVLRNVHHRETLMADKHFEMLAAQDFRLFYALDIPFPEQDSTRGSERKTLTQKISYHIGHMCEVAGATVASVIIVIALLVVASAMQWTETGQLLCNTPTMIVEGFLLLMLIQGHNGAEGKRRSQYTDILTRRLMLDRRISAWDDQDYELEVELLEEKHIDVLSVSEKYMM